jgi:hypothetical protein
MLTGATMRQLFAVSAVALLFATVTAFAADPVGSYSIEGSNPGGGSKYIGTVTVAKTGQTFTVVWVVGGTRYVGTGIGDKDFLAVSYTSGNSIGVALYDADGGNWGGVWSPVGGRQLGTELWKRK